VSHARDQAADAIEQGPPVWRAGVLRGAAAERPLGVPSKAIIASELVYGQSEKLTIAVG
jgi:hypothetical protein